MLLKESKVAKSLDEIVEEKYPTFANMIKSMKVVLAVMGIKNINQLNKSLLTFKNRNGEIYFDIDKYFHQKLHI